MKTKDFTLEVAARIKWLRNIKGYASATVADAIETTPDNYLKIERGRNRLSLEDCDKIARFYGVSCDFIVRGNYQTNATMFAEETLKKASEMLADLSTFLCNSGERMAESAVKPLDNVPY